MVNRVVMEPEVGEGNVKVERWPEGDTVGFDVQMRPTDFLIGTMEGFGFGTSRGVFWNIDIAVVVEQDGREGKGREWEAGAWQGGELPGKEASKTREADDDDESKDDR